ncbi:MAG: NACHT domain-containing protein, partial [Chloroflexi bacterium]|nr:NACHT domain-containing protein [Chloroflexota bacterium]
MNHSSSNQHISNSQEPLSTLSRFDWGDAIEAYAFYGRQTERLQLEQWIRQEHCKVVSVLGMGGIGKSALAVASMHQVAPTFQSVVFRSIRNATSCQDLLTDCLQVFLPQPLPTLPTSSDQCIDLLIECFQTQRSLLVLDNLETLLQEHDPEGRYCPGYEDYAKLLSRVAETPHQSCLLITSREAPAELGQQERNGTSVRKLHLKGLESEACEQLFTD